MKTIIAIHGKSSIWPMVKRPGTVGWKTSPCPTWLTQISPLLLEYVRLVPNTVVPKSKHKKAIESVNKATTINVTKKDDSDFIDMVDENIRIAFKQLRLMKQETVTYDRVLRKASEQESKALTTLLDQLVVDPEAEHPEDDGDDAAEEERVAPNEMPVRPVPRSWSGDRLSAAASSPAVLTNLFVRDMTSGQMAPAATSPAAVKQLMAADLSIFERVLDRKDSNASSLASPMKTTGATRSPGPPRKKRPQTEEPRFLHGLLAHLSLDDVEQRLLAESVQAMPINREGKTQLQRINANMGTKRGKGSRKGKGKGKRNTIGRGRGNAEGKSEAETVSHDSAKGTSRGRGKGKRASAGRGGKGAGKSKGRGKGEGKSKGRGGKGVLKRPRMTDAVAEEDAEKTAEKTAEKNAENNAEKNADADDTKVVDSAIALASAKNKRRSYQRCAYKKAKNEADAAGETTNAIKAAGKKAYREAGVAFDNRQAELGKDVDLEDVLEPMCLCLSLSLSRCA